MKIYEDIDQNSVEWYRIRIGKVTASELDNLISPTWEIRKGQMPQTYLHSKIAEAYINKPDLSVHTWQTEEGQLLEMESRKWYCFRFAHENCRQVGFVESDDERSGCSPDGLINDDGGLELKNPQQKAHVGYLLGGVLPPQYAAQVHGSMLFTGRKWWRFVSYHRRLPKFVLTVERDEAICAKITEALNGFYRKYDEALQKLKAAA